MRNRTAGRGVEGPRTVCARCVERSTLIEGDFRALRRWLIAESVFLRGVFADDGVCIAIISLSAILEDGLFILAF